jgi:hypothetical protein
VVAGARAEASIVFCKCRMLLLIGGAWYDVEHEGLGIDYPSDRVRLDMLEEAVQIRRAMSARSSTPGWAATSPNTQATLTMKLAILTMSALAASRNSSHGNSDAARTRYEGAR